MALGASLWWSGAPGASARTLLELSPQHVVANPKAKLDPTLRKEVLDGMKGRAFAGGNDVVAYALEVTGAHLHFGMAHKTSLAFTTAEREANCVEYAHLFGEVAELVAKEAKVDLKIRVVRSRATLAGQRIPLKGWDTHDWVLVKSGDETRFLDPSFDDAGLGVELTRVIDAPKP